MLLLSRGIRFSRPKTNLSDYEFFYYPHRDGSFSSVFSSRNSHVSPLGGFSPSLRPWGKKRLGFAWRPLSGARPLPADDRTKTVLSFSTAVCYRRDAMTIIIIVNGNHRSCCTGPTLLCSKNVNYRAPVLDNYIRRR